MPINVPFNLDNSLAMSDTGFTVIPFDLYAGETDFTVIDLGAAGIIPPVASFHTVSILAQHLTVMNGSLLINRTLGEYVILNVRSTVNSFQITNWPPAPFLGRIMLETRNEGDYTILWPNWIQWSRGRAPDLTIIGKDRFLFTTIDNGATVTGDVVGIDYRSI
jgi:hypothetical protein